MGSVICPCFIGGASNDSDGYEAHVKKPSSAPAHNHQKASNNQHDQKKITSEKVEERNLAVKGGEGRTKVGFEDDKEHKEDEKNVDKEAEDFIGKMKSAIRAERLKSMKRFQSMLNRGT